MSGHPCQEGSLEQSQLHVQVRAWYPASHSLPWKQLPCDSAVSIPTTDVEEHLKEFVKLTRSDVKYS